MLTELDIGIDFLTESLRTGGTEVEAVIQILWLRSEALDIDFISV